MLFLFASCDNQTNENDILTPSASETKQPTSAVNVTESAGSSESALSTGEQARQSFGRLRQAALDAVGDDSSFEAAVTRFLINYSDDTIILALNIKNPDVENDMNSEEESDKRYHVMEVAVCDYKLNGDKLTEGAYTVVPILVKVKKGTAQVQKVTVPELHNLDAQKKDIINIFGVESEKELGLFTQECDYETKERIWRGYEKKICSIKCQIAQAGGFSGFENCTLEIFDEIKDSGYFDKTTEEGAIRAYFLESNFRYDMLCLPYWHELGRESEDGGITLYLAMYIGHIYAMEDGTLMTGASSTVGKIKLGFSDGHYSVSEYDGFMGDGEQWLEGIEKYMGGYADDYLAFRETEEYDDMLFRGESLIDALIEGTFKPEDHVIN